MIPKRSPSCAFNVCVGDVECREGGVRGAIGGTWLGFVWGGIEEDVGIGIEGGRCIGIEEGGGIGIEEGGVIEKEGGTGKEFRNINSCSLSSSLRVD